MPKRPEMPTKGPRFFKRFAADIIAYVDAVRPISGVGTTVDESESGSPVNVTGATSSGDGGNTTVINNPPFDPSGLQSQIDALETLTTNQQTLINELTTRLNNASGSGRCDGDEIEITIDI